MPQHVAPGGVERPRLAVPVGERHVRAIHTEVALPLPHCRDGAFGPDQARAESELHGQRPGGAHQEIAERHHDERRDRQHHVCRSHGRADTAIIVVVIFASTIARVASNTVPSQTTSVRPACTTWPTATSPSLRAGLRN